MTPILAFDIETVPDVRGIRTLYDLPSEVADAEVVEFARQKRRARTGSDFMQHHLQQVVAISCCMRWGQDKIHVGTIGEIGDDEETVIARFFELIETHTPQLVSWNGGGFDLPVLHYRALFHGIPAARYFENGDNDNSYKYNNYLNRYQWRHLDLMDVLSGYQARSSASLNDVAKLCGFPGKLDMDGAAVQDRYASGDIKGIRDYCETDVLNTYLVYLRFELIRGNLTQDSYQQHLEEVATFLEEQDGAHWQAFLQTWAERDA